MPTLLSPGLLLALLLPSAALTIFSGPQWLATPWLPWVFKPLSTVLILLYAGSRCGDVPRRKPLILAGLVCSLAGDVALLWPQGFVAGLLAFLVAHLLYIVAFCLTARPAARRLVVSVLPAAADTVLPLAASVLLADRPAGTVLPVVLRPVASGLPVDSLRRVRPWGRWALPRSRRASPSPRSSAESSRFRSSAAAEPASRSASRAR